MLIVPRAQLLKYMVSDQYDYDQQFTRVFTVMATAIMADAPPDVTHFVLTDHENGDDLYVGVQEYDGYDSTDLVPLTDDDTGYFGVAASRNRHFDPGDNRVLYNCYLGGSPLASAPGFVISTAIMVNVE